MRFDNNTQRSLYWAMMNIPAGNPRWLDYACFYVLWMLAVILASHLAVEIGSYIIDYWL